MGVQRSSIPGATAPPAVTRHMGSAHAAIRSPRVWYALGIDPPISRLRLGCPTAGPIIPWGEGGGQLRRAGGRVAELGRLPMLSMG